VGALPRAGLLIVLQNPFHGLVRDALEVTGILGIPVREIVPGSARNRGHGRAALCLSVPKVPVVTQMKYPPPG
jgi:hypothetical protein